MSRIGRHGRSTRTLLMTAVSRITRVAAWRQRRIGWRIRRFVGGCQTRSLLIFEKVEKILVQLHRRGLLPLLDVSNDLLKFSQSDFHVEPPRNGNRSNSLTS